MAEETSAVPVEKDWLVKDLWEKYEQVAMHFNDLLIRLRIQALAGVAAISVVVGLFGKDANNGVSWELATVVFGLLIVLWIAIWVMDMLYYNRLLMGAVTAILDLEAISGDNLRTRKIDLSTKIEQAVVGKLAKRDGASNPLYVMRGPITFYVLILLALSAGFVLSTVEYLEGRRAENPQQEVNAPATRPPAPLSHQMHGGGR